jgi:hypothetical protein
MMKMISKRFSIILVLALSLIFLFVTGCAGKANNQGPSTAVLHKIQQSLQSKLNNLDSALKSTSSKLGKTGLSGQDARQPLDGLCNNYPFLNDCVAADATGKVTAAAPEAYRKFEGADLGTQDIKKATFTVVFKAIEGIDAVSLMQPVLSAKGEYMGIVSALFKPQVLIASIAEPALKGTGIELSVAQLDGLIIYNSEGDEMGQNLITYSAYQPYKDLVELHKKVIEIGRASCRERVYVQV